MDLYKTVADEFSLERAQVKQLAMALLYSMNAPSEDDLLDQMRNHVRTAIAIGLVVPKERAETSNASDT